MPPILSFGTGDIEIANMALDALGADPITSFTDTTRKEAILLNRHYGMVRDATLMAHHWNFAIKRVQILAYTEPATTLTLGATSGTAVQFLAGAALWATADIGKIVRHETIAGEGEITAIANTTQATAEITATFGSLGPFAAGVWRLFNDPPDWGLGNHFIKPTDFLRVHQVDEDDDPEYQVEGDFIASDEDTINLRYIAQITDPTKFTALFVRAFVAHLASIIVYRLTGKTELKGTFFKEFQLTIAEAQGLDSLEGTRDITDPTPLIDVRL